jgi:hypothetical protein
MLLLLACSRAPATPPAPAAAPPGNPTPGNPMLSVRGAAIEVHLPAGVDDPQRTELLDWVTKSADAVGAWYGGFPVPTLRLDVALTDGDRVGFATTWPGQPPHIDLPVGRGARTDQLDRDWILVHEMTHLAFPPVADEHHWLEEGLATYLEPWERVAVGRLSPELAWHDFVRDVPQGQTGQGLDHDGSWAATYWGGALYCLLADLAIREQTGNRLGLRDAVTAIAKSTGGMFHGGVHDLGPVLAIGDQATGTAALTDTWVRLRDPPPPVDLAKLWADLGVELSGDTVRFRDDAPKAAIRKAIAPVP